MVFDYKFLRRDSFSIDLFSLQVFAQDPTNGLCSNNNDECNEKVNIPSLKIHIEEATTDPENLFRVTNPIYVISALLHFYPFC